jgi:hypothetical protein
LFLVHCLSLLSCRGLFLVHCLSLLRKVDHATLQNPTEGTQCPPIRASTLVNPRLHQVLNWYNLVAALAAGGVPFCEQQRTLAFGSYPGRQCHSCCERTCIRVPPPPKKGPHHAAGFDCLQCKTIAVLDVCRQAPSKLLSQPSTLALTQLP